MLKQYMLPLYRTFLCVSCPRSLLFVFAVYKTDDVLLADITCFSSQSADTCQLQGFELLLR